MEPQPKPACPSCRCTHVEEIHVQRAYQALGIFGPVANAPVEIRYVFQCPGCGVAFTHMVKCEQSPAG